MAIRALPVLRDPLTRPVTVGDCREGVRPCPFLSCRFNMLIDTLEDGTLVLNAPSKRLTGADRTIPDQHDHERLWFVEVRIPLDANDRANRIAIRRGAALVDRARSSATARADRQLAAARARAAAVQASATRRSRASRPRTDRQRTRAAEVAAAARERASALVASARASGEILIEQAVDRAMDAADRVAGRTGILAIGPLGSSPRATEIAEAWEAEHGPNTTRIHRTIDPEVYEHVGRRAAGEVDRKFDDEADDAVEHWFDEPDPTLPSCLLDEIAKANRDDDGQLLEQIAQGMFVSRERVRQVESAAMIKFRAGLARAGLSIDDLRNED